MTRYECSIWYDGKFWPIVPSTSTLEHAQRCTQGWRIQGWLVTVIRPFEARIENGFWKEV